MFRNVILIVFVGIILLLTTSYLFFKDGVPQIPDKDQLADTNTKIISINGKMLTVEIADEPYEQTIGLSYRENLGSKNGMLFIFPQPIIPAFWMKDMHFALDMLWIDADGVILEISKNISPDTFPKTFTPASPIKYVLEVNAGWSDKNKIKTGDKLTLEN